MLELSRGEEMRCSLDPAVVVLVVEFGDGLVLGLAVVHCLDDRVRSRLRHPSENPLYREPLID